MNRIQLRAKFRSLIDDQGINGNIFSDERINNLLHDGALRVAEMLEELDEDLLLEEAVFNVGAEDTVAGTLQGVNKIISVQVRGLQDPREFESISIRQFPYYRREYGETMAEYRPAYAIVNDEIRYYAPYGTDHTLDVLYTRSLPDLEEDLNSWPLPAQAQRLIAYEAALIGLVAEDSDAGQMSSLVSDMRRSLTRNYEGRAANDVNYVSYRGD